MISLNVPKKQSIQVLNKFYRFLISFSGTQLKKDYYRNSDTPADFQKRAEEAGFSRVETFYVNPLPLFTPVGPKGERLLTYLYRFIYWLRSLVMTYPFKGSKLLAQQHFLIGWKDK